VSQDDPRLLHDDIIVSRCNGGERTLIRASQGSRIANGHLLCRDICVTIWQHLGGQAPVVGDHLSYSTHYNSYVRNRDPVTTSSPVTRSLETMSFNGVLGPDSLGCTRNTGPSLEGVTCQRMALCTPEKLNQNHKCSTRNNK
jgi:hypothetical protein